MMIKRIETAEISKTSLSKPATSASTISRSCKRSVRFPCNVSDMVTCQYIPTLDEISDAEIDATWYTNKEYRQIRKDMKAVLKKFIKSAPLSPDKEDARGLEFKTPTGTKQRQKNRFLSIDMVLDEQERHFEEQIGAHHSNTSRDSQAMYIAQIYTQSTIHCSRTAAMIGKEDAAYVQENVRESADDAVHELLHQAEMYQQQQQEQSHKQQQQQQQQTDNNTDEVILLLSSPVPAQFSKVKLAITAAPTTPILSSPSGLVSILSPTKNFVCAAA
uniref:Uncharacterized protein n=1 Tax=Craspedostauros australis TaxID=1486917 RepID=A0A7R9WVQ1_9STRA